MKAFITIMLITFLYGCHHGTQPQVQTAQPLKHETTFKHNEVDTESLMADFAHRY